MDTVGRQNLTNPSSAKSDLFKQAILPFFLATAMTVCGIVFGHYILNPNGIRHEQPTLVSAFAAWDGQRYRNITVRGYSYKPGRQSDVAFFPSYPLLCRALTMLTGLNPLLTLVIVANTFFFGSCILLALYLRVRHRQPRAHHSLTAYALCFWPSAYFFHVAYTESMFLFFALLAMYAMEKRWPMFTIALIISIATATRPVGILVIIPFVYYLWRQSERMIWFITNCLLYLPSSCTGILMYMSYQLHAFGTPFAFWEVQSSWDMRHAPSLAQKIWDLISLEPIYNTLDCNTIRSLYKNNLSMGMLGPYYLNTFLFVIVVLVIMVGTVKRWLTLYEVLLSFSLLGVSYFSRGYDFMMSMARHSTVVFPVFIAVSFALSKCHVSVVYGLLLIESVCLMVLASMFAAWYPFY